VAIDQLGAEAPPRDDPQTDDRFFHAVGLDTKDPSNLSVATNRFNTTQLELPKLADGTRSIGQFNDFAHEPMLWIASSNRFFATILRPLPMGDPKYITLTGGRKIVEVTHLASANVDLMKWAEKPSDALGIVRLTGAPVTVAPNATMSEPFAVFMGPKRRDLLDGSEAAAVGTSTYDRAVYEYNSVIQLSQGGCYSYCTFDWLARAILWLLNFLHGIIGNYGLAVMVLVIVVRAALHPLTRMSQINMAQMGKKMKDVQPQLEAIKKRYAGNKQKQTEETMRVYKENNVNPAGGIMGCLPMLIQMPIWAALYSGLRTDIDLRHASFIPGWITDLSFPDKILPAGPLVVGHPLFTLPLLGDIYGLNLLPILLAGVFFFQMKVMSASQPKPADEQQAQMQKMSQYMIFIFPLFLYNAPSGLNLYIFASTLGGLVDTWLVRKTLKKRGILPAGAQTLPTHEENA
jgi:YidC/Oxa1 family membrane protein insertase